MILKSLIAQGVSGGETLAEAVQSAVQEQKFDRLDVAVAYATRSGLKSLENACGGFPEVTRWVVGLDDAISQPEAIDDLINFPNVEIRLASLSKEGRRFHPKLYCFWSSVDPDLCLTVIGSANMTLHGFRKNGEVGVILLAENSDEADRLKLSWDEMWTLGEDATDALINAYREFHRKVRSAQRKLENVEPIQIQPEGEEPIPTYEGDPSTASMAWTECASPSAGGRDLEFPRKLMPFFDLTSSPTTNVFRVPDGQRFPLTFTERTNNQMWRLLFSRESIQAAIGRDSLRPIGGGNRSDIAISFTRAIGDADYDIDMVVIGSPEHQNLIDSSRLVDGLDRTRDPGGRQFGFF